ncbi:MAG TPA: MgtC/SapB family protein [Stellaceae bacterium]|jgi:putative Mg2+ transporter-C (MgtC) family protein
MIDFDLHGILYLVVRVAIAFALATLIGAERQYRQRSAGLRTNVLVAVGAASFVLLGERLGGEAGATQIAAYVVSGIGFLGAGVIMKEGAKVWGLNTAATLWCSAAVGALCGIGMAVEAAIVTMAVLAGNTLLRPLVNAINRAPLDERTSEANYEVRVVASIDTVDEVRELLAEELERASYPFRDIVAEEREDAVELIARLVSTAVEPAELDAVVKQLEAVPAIEHATWTSSAAGEA